MPVAEAHATVSRRRRVSSIWAVPIVALVLGAWMVIHTLRSQGPEITIVFSSAEGIEAGKTKVKVRNVEVGIVERVQLGDDLESVVVTTRLEKVAAPLLREDTQFWVVRPRVGPGGISGLGTLLSGGFIQLAPGTGKKGRRAFAGLDNPPITPAGTPGLRVKLVSDRAGSVGAGDPILYKGFRVGRVETATFDVASQSMHYDAFILAPYDDLVSTATRFWRASGISVSASADGFRVDTASLEALLIGGVAFGLPEGVEAAGAVEPGETFELHANYASVNERPYHHGIEYVVQFARSVRGLKPGAPLEYRGIRMGSVERILLKESLAGGGITGEGRPIPVLVRVEPGRLGLPDSEEGVEMLSRALPSAVANGMRATIATGNLLTGSLYIMLNFYPPGQHPGEIGTFAGRPTIPTIATGLEGLELGLTALLDKLTALPLDQVLDRVDAVLDSLKAILGSEEMRALPRSIDATLDTMRDTLASVSADSALQERLLRTLTELDHTLRSVRAVFDTLDEKPNSLIFSREVPPDVEPPAGSP
jgi:paraquat-inducible protein B